MRVLCGVWWFGRFGPTSANGIELTEQEAELYDRRIRLWELDSQKRPRAVRVLLAGLNDQRNRSLKHHPVDVKEADFCSQFLAPQTALGTNRGEASLGRAQHLNPMVELKADTEKLEEHPDILRRIKKDIEKSLPAKVKQILRVEMTSSPRTLTRCARATHSPTL